jgi:hypothetical protein
MKRGGKNEDILNFRTLFTRRVTHGDTVNSAPWIVVLRDSGLVWVQ